MNCPNCKFEVQEDAKTCPFCNFNIPSGPAAGGGEAVPAAGGGEPVPAAGESEPASADPAAVPAPGGEDDFEVEAIESPSDDPMLRTSDGDATRLGAPEAEGPPLQPAGPDKKQETIKYAAIIGVALLAFKIGLFDNILLAVGLKSPPPPAEAAAAAPPAEPAEEAEPEEEAEYEEPEEEEPALPQPPAELPHPPVKEEPKIVEKPKVPAEWWFYGKIYDMVTLKSIAGVEMTFVGDQEITIRTNHKGQYQAKLPIPGDVSGYDLLVEHEAYLDQYYREKSPSYRKMSLRRRGQMRAVTPKHRPWSGTPGKWIRRDLILFPNITDR